MAAPAKRIELHKNGKIKVVKICIFCMKESEIIVSQAKYEQWDRGGEHVQDLFPALTPGERETLISGTHESCFDEAFPVD